MKTMLKKIRKHSERGQAIILIAFSIIGLVAIVGLMIDGGILLIEYARLKRAIDSASIAAASQFRKPGSGGSAMGIAMENAGREFLGLNQADAQVDIFTCSYPGTNHDELLCKENMGGENRKLVRVDATRRVDFGFMRVLGFDHTTIGASSMGEAASVDLVLMIDTSASMAFETKDGGNPNGPDSASGPNYTTDDQGDNPDACNDFMADADKRCEPLGIVKDAAISFVGDLYYPYDRVAIVTTTSQDEGGNRLSAEVPKGTSFMDNFADHDNNPSTAELGNTEVQDALRGLRVFQPIRCTETDADKSLGGCLNFDASNVYQGMECPERRANGNPTKCGSSNIGGGIYKAAEQFYYARQNSFWVVIALIGGPANATNPVAGHDDGLCPGSTGQPTWVFPPPLTSGYCRWRDSDPYNPLTDRHYYTIDNTDPNNPKIVYPSDYDPDDYARDAADYLANPKTVGATVFSVCMGGYCRGYPSPDPLSAEHLGKYVAEEAGDVGTVRANHGQYYYAEQPEDLGGENGVFAQIAKSINTRISK